MRISFFSSANICGLISVTQREKRIKNLALRCGFLFLDRLIINMDKNNQIPQPDIDSLILKYVDGRITRPELAELESWLQESESNLQYYRQFRNMLDNNYPVNINTGAALEGVLQKINPGKEKSNVLFILQRIAAVLFIPLFLSFLLYFIFSEDNIREHENTFTTITAAFGTVSSFELADGSKVWLNSGSSLQVPEKFKKNKRLVKLVGEAYFEVRSNAFSPFLVQAADLTVEATGTKFNVMAYPDGQSSVTLAEGKVTITEEVSDEKILLLPGQHLAIGAENRVQNVEGGDVYKYYAWKDGKLVFRNDLLSDMIRRISLQYNVDIETLDAGILQNRYRATFDNESLTEVLDLLKLASPFSYREIPPVYQPDGSYSKRKIIITSSKPNQK
jgi:ferric-dicitrate binding protein FerR (iron transport regulator)